MWANWNHSLCSPAAIPPQAVILRTFTNYQSGCGWICTPKGNLLPWSSPVCGEQCVGSAGGTLTLEWAQKPWTMLHGQGSINPDSFFPQSFQEPNGCTLLRTLIFIYALLKSIGNTRIFFPPKNSLYAFDEIDFFKKGNNHVLYSSWMIPL